MRWIEEIYSKYRANRIIAQLGLTWSIRLVQGKHFFTLKSDNRVSLTEANGTIESTYAELCVFQQMKGHTQIDSRIAYSDRQSDG